MIAYRYEPGSRVIANGSRIQPVEEEPDNVGLNRVQSILQTAGDVVPVASYRYCGVNGVRTVRYPQPGLELAVTANLDATDNWTAFGYLRTPPDPQAGLDAETIVQRRRHNARDQITALTPFSPASRWPLPKYDAAGNTTRIPAPNAPGEAWDCKCDAWNRLRQIKRGGKLFLVFDYDGLGRRIRKRTYDRGNLRETRYYWYDDPWRILEERVQRPSVPLAKTPPERVYVWGQRGLNDLVLRLRGTSGDGTLNKKLYALHDANFNTIALSDPVGQTLFSPLVQFSGAVSPSGFKRQGEPVIPALRRWQSSVAFPGLRSPRRCG